MSNAKKENSSVDETEVEFEEIDGEVDTPEIEEDSERSKQSSDELSQEDTNSSLKVQEKTSFVSQREIISIIFSKKTLYHVLVLFVLLTFFGIISYTKSDLASSLILIFGYGGSLGYFVTAALNRFEVIKNLSRSQSFTSLILPLSLSLVFSSFIWATLNNEIYGENTKRFLTWGYILIFVLWQFAQAWWMRVPFKEIALRQMSKSAENETSKKGIWLNLLSPFIWMLIGTLCFYFVSTQISGFKDNFDSLFMAFWVL